MELWQQVGQACTEDEIDDFQLNLQEVEATRVLCQEDVNYKVDSTVLKRFNRFYKLYKHNIGF